MNNTKPLENWKKYKINNEDIVENWCGACLAIPLAFVGVGASAYGSSSRGKYKQQKKWSLYIGIFSVILSIIIAIYYLYFKKCTDCLYTGK